ncbi:MAG TPA: 30S ribosomal protein S11 [Planctomycetes bacterium]|nr:30S ribosomal protein S11 [Planctomycetota bacterium]
MAKTYAKKKVRKVVPRGVAHVLSTFNNTYINITDPAGNSLCWISSGTIGFAGSRKSTPFAAQRAGEAVAEKAVGMGMQEVEVRVKGPGAGRESAIRGLQSGGLAVSSILDVTPVPHNGCRPPKRRRV